MKNIVIFSSKEDWFMPLASDPGELRIQLTAQPSVPSSADCVLISQQFIGNQLGPAIEQLRQFRIPCAVVTYDNTPENQAYLLRYGADDVIVLPMCGELMRKRIQALTNRPLMSEEELNFAAFDRIVETNQGNGSFVVAEHDFVNIYRFVSRLLERLDQKAQLILFRVNSEDGPFVEADAALHFLKIVQASLRKGDISCVAGRQVMVILMGADTEGGQLVINRVLSAFNAHYNMDESCDISYEIREISKSSSFAAS